MVWDTGYALLAVWSLALLCHGSRSWIAWTIISFLVWAIAAYKSPKIFSAKSGYWWLWAGWLAVSAVSSVEPWTSAWSILHRGTYVLFVSLALAAFEEKHRRDWLMSFFILGGFFGIYALALRHPLDPNPGWLPPNSNYSACFLAAVFCAAAAVLLHPRSRLGTSEIVGLSSLMILAALSIWFLKSRGAWLAIILITPMLIIWRGGSKALIAMLACAVVGLSLIPARWLEHVSKINYAANSFRTYIWKTGIAVFKDFKWAGIGPGCFERGYFLHNFPAFDGLTYYGHYADHAHSEPLELAAESGWPGAVLYVWAFVATLISGWKKMVSENSPFRLAAIAAALAVFAHSLIDGILALPGLQFLFFSALACAASGKGENAPPERGYFKTAAVGGLVFCLVLNGIYFRNHEKSWWNRADYTVHLQAARRALLSREPNPAQAEVSIMRALELNPTNAIAWGLRAELARMAGDWQGEERFAWKSIGLEPNFVMGHVILAEALLHQGRTAEARAIADRVEAIRRNHELKRPANEFEDLILLFDYGRFKKLQSALALG